MAGIMLLAEAELADWPSPFLGFTKTLKTAVTLQNVEKKKKDCGSSFE